MILRPVLTLAAALLLGGAAARAADQPGQKFNISANSLPKPYATPGVANSSTHIARPQGALPRAPAGFKVDIYAAGLTNPRWMVVAPNGDAILAESSGSKLTLLRDVNGKMTASLFADGFRT